MRGPVDLLGASRWYKGVTSGEKISDVDALTFASRGKGIKPHAPSHLSGQRAADGTRTVRWIRRARFGALWRDGGDARLHFGAVLKLERLCLSRRHGLCRRQSLQRS